MSHKSETAEDVMGMIANIIEEARSAGFKFDGLDTGHVLIAAALAVVARKIEDLEATLAVAAAVR